MAADAPILHHYPSSPFAEKVRLVLGAKRIAWRSVLIPTVMPKPDLVALTGGYRRTPVMQIGADVYCDTALIVRVLDARVPEPPLVPPGCEGLAPLVAQWADQQLFWTAVPYTMQPAALAHVFGPDLTPEAMKAFREDRAAFAPHAPRLAPPDADAALRTMLGWMESVLARGPWLAGPARSLADFAAAHPLWFVKRAPPAAVVLDAFPHVRDWLDRTLADGHGEVTRCRAAEAIADAAAAGAADRFEPLAVEPGLGFDDGAAVTVSAVDTGTDPVAGRLVGLTRDRVTLARTDDRAGRVHVHFPRVGFRIRQETPA